MKLIFLDIETTGIPCPQSGLIQLAGLIEVDGQAVETFDFRVRPFPNDVIAEEALRVNGVTREALKTYPEPGVVFSQLMGLLAQYVDRYDKEDKLHFVAYNARFDADHLRAWFEKNGDKYFGSWFWHPPIDVMSLAAAALMDKRHTLADFRLPGVAKALGIAVNETRLHDAVYDVELTREVFYRLISGRPGESGKVKL